NRFHFYALSLILKYFEIDWLLFKIYMGRNCYFIVSSFNVSDGGQITIGDNVFIGPNCGFYTATHPLNFYHRNEGYEKAGPIH
ncbi:hypothetical protein P7584_15565, partial [Staphylococcus aureus]|nr:hypothetical protein [Staphylococcus aureus]